MLDDFLARMRYLQTDCPRLHSRHLTSKRAIAVERLIGLAQMEVAGAPRTGLKRLQHSRSRTENLVGEAFDPEKLSLGSEEALAEAQNAPLLFARG